MTAVKWVARAAGLFATGFFALFILGHIPEFIDKGSLPSELSTFLPLLAGAAAGSVVSLFRPTAGGVMQAAFGVLMAAWHLLLGGGIADLDTALIFGLPYLISGALSYISGRGKKG